MRAAEGDTREDASGNNQLDVNAQVFDAESMSELGALPCREARCDLYPLLKTGGREALWHGARSGAQNSSRFLFLTCEDLP